MFSVSDDNRFFPFSLDDVKRPRETVVKKTFPLSLTRAMTIFGDPYDTYRVSMEINMELDRDEIIVEN